MFIFSFSKQTVVCVLNNTTFAFPGPWMVGAAGSAFYINDAATVLPRTVMAKARTYLAGALVDVFEV